MCGGYKAGENVAILRNTVRSSLEGVQRVGGSMSQSEAVRGQITGAL